MADMLATVDDLNTMLDETVPEATATLLLETATGTVQAAAGQRLVAVADETITLLGTTDSWLGLPERPVTAVGTVTLDGEPVTDFRRFGARLYRRCGWASCAPEPGEVAVTYSHGYAPDDPGIQLARQMTLVLAIAGYTNPTGSTSLAIDDYREGYGGNAGEQSLTQSMRAALRRAYGRRGGLVRIG